MGIPGLRLSRKTWALAALTAGAAFSAHAAGADSAGLQAVSMAHRMMMLVMQLGAILFAARLGNMLFLRLRMPGVLGELCAGVVIGPYALGRIHLPGFENGLFPEFFMKLADGGHELRFVVSPELYGICMLAAVVLLFLVGLETDLNLFLRYSVVGSLVGVGGVFFSFLSGDLLGVWLLPWVAPGTYTPTSPACIFLGVLATATSVSITARILSERKKMESPEGVTILAGAVIDDVLGIILLAIGMGVIGVAGSSAAQRIDWGGIGVMTLKALGIWLGATVAGLLSARKIGNALKQMGGHSEIAILALGLALIVAGLFEKANLTMIIGSYVMGLSLSRTDISHMVREHLQPVFGLLVPVFFAVMGMMVDMKVMLSPKILLFGLIYTAVSVLSKLVGCGLPTLLCGFNLKGAMRVGVGMVPRGEVALIIAGIGLSSGFLSKEVFGITVMMTLLTTLAAPPLLIAAFNVKGSGLRAGKGKILPSAGELSVYTFPNEEVGALLLNALMKCFSLEGYFAHTLNMSEGLHQVRKDDIVINIKRVGNTLEIDAPSEAVTVVRLMMIEVIVEFEQTLKELRKPLGTELHAEITAVELAAAERFHALTPHLSQDTMVPDLKASTKRDAIAELIDVLARRGLVKDPAAALASALKREDAMSTGLRHGIASPHARTEAVERLVCAIGLKAGGLEFQSLDAQPARVIILTLCPTSAEAPYMAFMGAVMAALREESAVKKLLECRTSGEMFRALVPEKHKQKSADPVHEAGRPPRRNA
jgi:Kef-type K+ transport system membrane component KefB/mannitol/fructose-specific phosphotransferase system IIA component (Ntr-type)